MQKNKSFYIYPALACITLVVFWQVSGHEFVNFDDGRYVYNNTHVKEGLTTDGFIWAFSTIDMHNWHPLTWLSYMLDYELFGLKAGYFHITNLFFHIANTLLLFALLKQLTGAVWRSAFVAACFALHPLHVESVAWIAERKDVLSTFFWMLTILIYIQYARRPNIARFILLTLTFCLGLMAKQMLVTLPIVLLLLDYWPLKRFEIQRRGCLGFRFSSLSTSFRRCILEKLFLFIFSIAASATVYVIQETTGLVQSVTRFSLSARVSNAFVSYIEYIIKMFYPVRMVIFYPHPGDSLALWKVAGAFLLLVGITALCLWRIRKNPYFAVGWLWYVITLIPVIGFVQLWEQAMADRYTYIPSIGIFIIVAWGFTELFRKLKYRKVVLSALASASLVILSVLTYIQVGYWHNSGSLYSHALDVTKNNYIAHSFIAHWYFEQGDINKSISHHQQALRIRPFFADEYVNLGAAYLRLGKIDKSIEHSNKALSINPDLYQAYVNLGQAYVVRGNIDKAIEQFNKSLDIKADHADAYRGLGRLFLSQSKFAESIENYQKALELSVDDPACYNDMGVALYLQGRHAKAIEYFKRTVELTPDSAQAHYLLARALIGVGRGDDAIATAEKALQLSRAAGNAKLTEEIEKRLGLYKNSKTSTKMSPK